VWGLDPSTKVSFHERLTPDSFGSPSYWNLDVADPRFQQVIESSWNTLISLPTIDSEGVDQFARNPWDLWSYIGILVNATGIDWIVSGIFDSLNLTQLPLQLPVTSQQYSAYWWLWQLLLTKLGYEEPEPYAKGTNKASLIGFSMDTMDLNYIAIKAPLLLPDDHILRHSVLRQWYEIAMDLEQRFQENASRLGLPDSYGWITSFAFLSMVTEEMIPTQILIASAVGIGIAAFVVICCTRSAGYTLIIVVAMCWMHLFVLGVFSLAGWEIGYCDASFFSIVSGLVSTFLIYPSIGFVFGRPGKTVFGQQQQSMVAFSAPILYAIVGVVAAAALMYPCDIVLLQPFATAWIVATLFAAVIGIWWIPAMAALVFARKCGMSIEPTDAQYKEHVPRQVE